VSPGPAGAALGALCAAGLLLTAGALRRRRPVLADRLAPYLRGTLGRSALLDVRSAGRYNSAGVAGPLLHRLAGFVENALGGAASVHRRLEAAGDPRSVEDFRVEQVIWGAGGFVVGLLVAGVASAQGRADPAVLLVGCLGTTLAGVLGRDRWLTRSQRRRESRILAELPTVAELLALAVSAGEGPLAALERVATVGHGELAGELGRTLADVRAGTPLTTALQRTARRNPLPGLGRFIDGLVVAIERGTPLADVLHAQARDVREAGKRALLETAGRREIGMLLPVVFLILPVVVLFALFPGFYTLALSVP
jgi:tight adherence protein C